MYLESLVADLHAFQKFLLHVGHPRGSKKRGKHIFVREDVVEDCAGLDDTRPADGTRHTIGTFPVTRLLVAEGRNPTVRPGELFRAVVSGVHYDRVILEAEFLKLVE